MSTTDISDAEKYQTRLNKMALESTPEQRKNDRRDDFDRRSKDRRRHPKTVEVMDEFDKFIKNVSEAPFLRYKGEK